MRTCSTLLLLIPTGDGMVQCCSRNLTCLQHVVTTRRRSSYTIRINSTSIVGSCVYYYGVLNHGDPASAAPIIIWLPSLASTISKARRYSGTIFAMMTRNAKTLDSFGGCCLCSSRLSNWLLFASTAGEARTSKVQPCAYRDIPASTYVHTSGHQMPQRVQSVHYIF